MRSDLLYMRVAGGHNFGLGQMMLTLADCPEGRPQIVRL